MLTGDCPRTSLHVRGDEAITRAVTSIELQLAGISQGLRNRQIAEQLQLGEHTVKFHVRNILDKLEVTSRGEAAALARDLRLDPVATHRSA